MITTKTKYQEYQEMWRRNHPEYFKNYLKKWIENIKKIHPYYLAFYQARDRCQNKKNKDYKYYGKKKIKFLITLENLHTLWIRDKAFLMEKPSIDRIDSSGNYSLENCRFIEMTQNQQEGLQAMNKKLRCRCKTNLLYAYYVQKGTRSARYVKPCPIHESECSSSLGALKS